MAITRKNSRYYVARDPLRSNLIVVSLLVAQIASECAQPAPEVKANFAKNEASLYYYNKILARNCEEIEIRQLRSLVARLAWYVRNRLWYDVKYL